MRWVLLSNFYKKVSKVINLWNWRPADCTEAESHFCLRKLPGEIKRFFSKITTSFIITFVKQIQPKIASSVRSPHPSFSNLSWGVGEPGVLQQTVVNKAMCLSWIRMEFNPIMIMNLKDLVTFFMTSFRQLLLKKQCANLKTPIF